MKSEVLYFNQNYIEYIELAKIAMIVSFSINPSILSNSQIIGHRGLLIHPN